MNVNEKPFNGVVFSQYIQTSQNRLSFADGGNGNLFAQHFLIYTFYKNGDNTLACEDDIGGVFVTRQARVQLQSENAFQQKIVDRFVRKIMIWVGIAARWQILPSLNGIRA